MKRTIIITGGSDGLGKSIAKIFSPEDNVYILAPDEKRTKNAANEINCKYFVCDITDFNVSQKIVDCILSTDGKIDILINNAGLWIQGKLEDNDTDDIKRTIDTNLFGTVNMCKHVIPSMKKLRDGTIININSLSGYFFKSERSVYNATKWAITGFTGSLRLELESFGIRVMDFHPGLMKTKIFDKAKINKNISKGLDTDSVAKALKLIVDLPKNIVIPDIGIINNIYFEGGC